jgi:hypothetical protein
VQAIRVAGLIAELDLEGVVGKNLDDSTDLTRREPEFGQVRDESDRIEKLDGRMGGHMALIA